MHNIVTSSSDLYAVFIESWQAEWHLWLLIDGWWQTLTEMTGVCWSAPSQSGRAPAPGPSPRCRLSSTGRGSPSPGSSRSGRAWRWRGRSVLFTLIEDCFYVCYTIKQSSLKTAVKHKMYFLWFSCSNLSLSRHRAQHDPGPEAALNWQLTPREAGTDAGAGAASVPGLWTRDWGATLGLIGECHNVN